LRSPSTTPASCRSSVRRRFGFSPRSPKTPEAVRLKQTDQSSGGV
jgi:hypothetical protein